MYRQMPRGAVALLDRRMNVKARATAYKMAIDTIEADVRTLLTLDGRRVVVTGRRIE